MQRDMTSLDNRLTEMELRDSEARKSSRQTQAQIEEYTKMRESLDQELRGQSAGLYAQIEELREEIRILNGKLEEMEYALKVQQKANKAVENSSQSTSNRLTDLSAKQEERIARLERYLNLDSPGKTAEIAPTKTSDSPIGVQKELTEEEIYMLGKQALDQGDSDTAGKRFQEFIQRYPKSENADNAQFWIGEIYYREKWYEKAILEYQKVIENYPEGNKVPAALLKQGLAFANLGDQSNSRIILEELVRKYPNSNEAKIAGDKLKEFR